MAAPEAAAAPTSRITIPVHSSHVSSLASLRDPREIAALASLAVHSVADLASHPAFRHAELLLGLERNGTGDPRLLEAYLDRTAQWNGAPLRNAPVTLLRTVSEPEARAFRDGLGLRTLAELATWPPFLEAVRRVERAAQPAFSEPASAPDALVPSLVGSTHTTTRLGSYVRDRSYVVEGQRLVRRQLEDEVPPRPELLKIFTREACAFDLGYLALVRQTWLDAGTHLGDIVKSLALAPGESRNIAVVDWIQRQRSSRREDTTASETLASEFVQTRALNEVVATTAREHLQGRTEVDATTRTTGLGVTGGVGGGAAHASSASGSATGSDLAALLGIPLPLPGQGQGAASDLLSGAGGLGASFVHSGGTVQGTLVSETSGERTVMGELVQNISDATVQNSSNVRALMSTVVIEDVQGGRQRGQTRNVTNYNHSHALTIQYYEVIKKCLVRTSLARLTPVLYLPFRPIEFTIDFVREYWPLLRRPVRAAFPARFREWDRVVKNYDPRNNAFDAGGEIEIDSIRITSVRDWSSIAKVDMTEANPSLKLSFPGHRLDDTLTLVLAGGSTYVSYAPLLDESFSQDRFGSRDGMPIDESITCRITSAFRQAFRRELKATIEDARKKELDTNRGFNELGGGHNKPNLKDDVDDGRYAIINKSDGVTLTLDLEMTLRDSHGNTEVVTHQHTVTYSYDKLHGEVDEVLFNVSDVVRAALETTADFNPLGEIEDIEDHFRLHRYGYTRYLLGMLEKEQVIDVVDHLAAARDGTRIPLSRIVEPSPLGVVENFLIFRLRELQPGADDHEPDGIRDICARYVAELRAEAKRASRWDRTETVFLPTAGLFGEAILGRSNASEVLDIRRFHNWQDSPIPNAAPPIVAVDVNASRGNGVADGLEPTVAASTLAQIAPIQYPLPTSLAAALQAVQNGQMFTDMSKAAEFSSILGNLSALASRSAELAGTLSGDALAKALESANALGAQVASLTQSAMQATTASPPRTLTEKGAQIVNAERVAGTLIPHGALSCLDIVRIEAGGTDVVPCTKGGTPSPPPDDGDDGGDTPDDEEDDDDDGEDEDDDGGGDPPATGRSVITLPIRFEVPHPVVRLDIAGGAWNLIPAGYKSYFEQFVALAGSWASSIGFDEDGGLDAAKDALVTLALGATGIGELMALIEGLRSIADFLGVEGLPLQDVADLTVTLIGSVVQSLQALVLPALSGDVWLAGEVRVVIEDGVAMVSIPTWEDPAITYGYLGVSVPVEGGAWWAGSAASFVMASSVRIGSEQVQTTATIDDDDVLVVRMHGAIPLALDWLNVVATQQARVEATVAELLRLSGAADAIGSALGVDDPEAYLLDLVHEAFAWMQVNVVRPLEDYFVPHLDFDIAVRIHEDPVSGWAVMVEGAHDAFPRYVVSLTSADGEETKQLYAEPRTLESSAEGPLALLDPIMPTQGSPRTTVPADWIVPWAETAVR